MNGPTANPENASHQPWNYNTSYNSKCNIIPAYILAEEVLKTSFVFVFRRRLDLDECIRFSHSPSEDVFKTSWSRPIYLPWPYVFKTSSRRFQDDFKTSCKNVFKASSRFLQDVLKTSSRHLLQDVLPRRLQNVFKTSCKDAFKMFWRRIIRLNCLPRSRICLGHTSEEFMVSAENLQVW